MGNVCKLLHLRAWRLRQSRLPVLAFGASVAPRIGLRAHYASGDDNLKNHPFHNFTGAYPVASVISEMSLLSVSNVTNLRPYVQLFTRRGVVLDANWNFVRKVAVADSVYGPIGMLFTAKDSTSLDVARIGQLEFTGDINHFVQLKRFMRTSLPDNIRATPAGAISTITGCR